MRLALSLTVAIAGCASGCDFERMIDQPRCEADEACPALEGGATNLPPPAHVVSWKSSTAPAETGARGAAWLTELPIALDRPTMERGRDRFEVFCAACHGLTGDGITEVAENMSVRPPPALTSNRIAGYPAGRVYAVITGGWGLMPAYAQQLPVADRWAVVGYLRALQLSQRAELDRLPEAIAKEAEQWLR